MKVVKHYSYRRQPDTFFVQGIRESGRVESEILKADDRREARRLFTKTHGPKVEIIQVHEKRGR